MINANMDNIEEVDIQHLIHFLVSVTSLATLKEPTFLSEMIEFQS